VHLKIGGHKKNAKSLLYLLYRQSVNEKTFMGWIFFWLIVKFKLNELKLKGQHLPLKKAFD